MQETLAKLALTVPEAANASGVCRTSIFAALKRGELRRVKIGKSTRILTEDLKSWLREKVIAA